jgi:excisionase family DNA binding protein
MGFVAMSLLTASQVAEQLSVAVSTVYGLVDGGSLVAIDLSVGGKRRSLRFKPEAVIEFLDRSQTKQTLPMKTTRRRGQGELCVVGLERMRKRGFKG